MRQIALWLFGICLHDIAYGLLDSTCSLDVASGKTPTPSVLQAKSTLETSARPNKAKKGKKAPSPAMLKQAKSTRQTTADTEAQPYNSMQERLLCGSVPPTNNFDCGC
eukprot:3131351-Amphidinium_carterae.1